MIQQQIKDREQHSLLESEKKDQETKAMLEYLERLQIEDIKEMEEKVTRQYILMADIGVANDEIQRQKLLQKEQEKIAESKVRCLVTGTLECRRITIQQVTQLPS